jgi:hypothetical protein
MYCGAGAGGGGAGVTTAAFGGGVSTACPHGPGKHEQPAIKIPTQKINNTSKTDLFIAHLLLR